MYYTVAYALLYYALKQRCDLSWATSSWTVFAQERQPIHLNFCILCRKNVPAPFFEAGKSCVCRCGGYRCGIPAPITIRE